MAPPSRRGWEMITIITVLVALATISAILRVVARVKLSLRFAMDDYLCFVGMILLYSMYIELVLWCTIGGNGSHIYELNPITILNFGKIFISNQFSYFLLSPCIKISIICFYQRIFPTPRFRMISTIINYVIGLWGAGIFLTSTLQCRPLAAFWDQSIQGHCINGKHFFIINQGFNVVADFVILGMPLPIIWSLKRAWQDKLALSSIFALGGFVCFASIYRIVSLFYINDEDPTYTVYQATLWTHIEPAVGMICSCLPTIRGLFPVYTFARGPSGVKSSHKEKYAHGSAAGQSHLTSSTSRNSAYIKMHDIKVYNGKEASEENLFKPTTNVSQNGITVKTEVKVTRDNSIYNCAATVFA